MGTLLCQLSIVFIIFHLNLINEKPREEEENEFQFRMCAHHGHRPIGCIMRDAVLSSIFHYEFDEPIIIVVCVARDTCSYIRRTQRSYVPVSHSAPPNASRVRYSIDWINAEISDAYFGQLSFRPLSKPSASHTHVLSRGSECECSKMRFYLLKTLSSTPHPIITT